MSQENNTEHAETEPSSLPTDQGETAPKKEINILELTRRQLKPQMDVEYRDEMIFTLSYLPRPRLQSLAKEATVMRINPRTATREPEVDNERFTKLFVREVVHGWKKVTPLKLAKIIPIDLTGFTDTEKDAVIPYSEPQMVVLMREAYDLDQFLQAYVQDLRNFEPNMEHERKNSESSQSGS